MRETARLPAVVFGTSSDRIGTPAGNQCYFVTISKQWGKRPFAPYFSLNYSEFERGMTFPFGISVSLGRDWLLIPMYDGHASHTVLTWSGRNESIGLVLAWNRQLGITFSYGF